MTTAHDLAADPGPGHGGARGDRPQAPAVPAARQQGQTVGEATALLDAYRPGGTAFFGSPTRTLLARGVRARVPHGDAPLAERVADTLRAARAQGVERPVVIGAVPFDAEAPARLFVPELLHTTPPLERDPLIALDAPPAGPAAWTVRPHPEPLVYEAAVAEAVRRMADGRLDKAVLARTLELTAAEPFDLTAMLRRLARRDPGGHTFAVPAGEGRTLLGASPELLVSRHGSSLRANPLAGSTPRRADLAEDVTRAVELLASSKDRREHAVVADAVRAALAPYCARLDVPDAPTLARTAAMWHLSTTLTGELAQPLPTAIELASALHPTPAVCGTPTEAARELIGAVEPFDRGLYAGMVGWQDADGDGEWVVTIRCAEADEHSLRLYAGAGVVPGSRPEAELAETAAKFRTFLDAVGVSE